MNVFRWLLTGLVSPIQDAPEPVRKESATSADLLIRERQIYQDNLWHLLREHPGKWTVVCGKEVSTYPTQERAVYQARQMYGERPFLVRRIQRETSSDPR